MQIRAHAGAFSMFSLALVILPGASMASGGLGRRGALRAAHLDAGGLQGELGEAMAEALGCGGHVGEEHLAEIEEQITHMWQTLPKVAGDRVERRSLRYLVHRHFNRKSALHIRGFEPTRPANASGWGDADILSQRVPAFVESVLESRHKLERGFSQRDAAVMIATLEQLIFDSESALLEKVYKEQFKPIDRSLSTQGLGQVLESYMVHWMMSEDKDAIRLLLANRTLLETSFPHWEQLVGFVHGEMKSLDFRRQNTPHATSADASSRRGHNALAQRYSFDDAHGIIGGITKSFASYWESECASMKEALIDMDTRHTGRVPLSKFYSSGLDSDWRFGESETYLRELGALDETNVWIGKQVIIPNYIQAASNCIVSAPHYLVCCVNDCEGLLGEIEEAVGAPVAEPSELLAIVGNLSSQATLSDDPPRDLKGSLTSQLEQIAAAHGGRIPLHGRLFAQWLHYAFPRECAFPHKSGTANVLTPTEFGSGYIAKEEEMKEHAAAVNTSNFSAVAPGEEQQQWMSQWTAEEELIADYTGSGLRAPWETSGRLAWYGGAALLVATLLGAVGSGRKAGAGSALLPMHGKAHFV